MPRPRKAPRLYLRRRGGRDPIWVILDGSAEISTGCGRDDARGAESALSRYLAEKYTAPGALPPDELYVDEVLAAYLKEHAEHSPSREFLFHTARPIAEWWSGKRLSEVNGRNCRAYVDWRTAQVRKRAKRVLPISEQTARHELKTLRTAINYYHREHGPLPSKPAVTLPPRGAQRVDYWLTRSQVAARLRAARRHPESRHLPRLILIGVYTGTRPGAILELKWLPSTTAGWFDLEAGILHRRGTRSRRSRKRAPPARIHARLLPHLKRWRAADAKLGIASVVHYQGRPIAKLRRSWASAATAAGHTRREQDADGSLRWIVADAPHILRHTAATWLMQAGVDLFEAAGFLGMTPDTLWETYGHHHPRFQSAAAQAMPKKPVNRTRTR